MDEGLRSILIGTLGLDVALLVALHLTLHRGNLRADSAARRSAVRLALVAAALQALHFGEELATGFDQRFPELLGLLPWPLAFFVAFNVAWLAIWALAAAGLSAGVHAALLPIWFLGIGAALNGVVHPLLALGAGGYFPGLVTSPLLGVAGLLLLRRLVRLTGRPGVAARA